jgi:hypothetical protein
VSSLKSLSRTSALLWASAGSAQETDSGIRERKRSEADGRGDQKRQAGSSSSSWPSTSDTFIRRPQTPFCTLYGKALQACAFFNKTLGNFLLHPITGRQNLPGKERKEGTALAQDTSRNSSSGFAMAQSSLSKVEVDSLLLCNKDVNNNQKPLCRSHQEHRDYTISQTPRVR